MDIFIRSRWYCASIYTSVVNENTWQPQGYEDIKRVGKKMI